MAISGREQRLAPLVDSVHFWKPWGPGKTTPGAYPDDEDEIDSETLRQSRAVRMSRSRTWSGYSTYAQFLYLAAAKGDHNHWTFQAPRGRSSTDEPRTSVTRNAQANAVDTGSVKSNKLSQNRPPPIEAVKQNFDSSRSSATQDFFATGKTSKRKKRGRAKNRDGSGSPSGCSSPDGSHSPESSKPSRHKGSSRSAGSSHSPSGNGSGSSSPVASGPITTLMIRNLPHTLTQAELLDELDRSGYAGLYDFCYLPHEFKKHRNVGFAFLNFVTAEDCAKFREDWHLSKRFTETYQVNLNVSIAAVQGREANERKAASQKMSRVRNPGYRPVVFDGTGQVQDSESSPLFAPESWNEEQSAEATDSGAK